MTARISAATVENQMPSMPQISGSRRTQAIWNIRVRRKEIAAEMKPLLSAVKNEEPKMEIPENRNARAKIENAWRVNA